MSYIANVTDKQQSDIERATDDSSIRFAHFDGKAAQTGQMKAIKANDLQGDNSGVSATVTAQSAVKKLSHIIAPYNDNAGRFDNPGKA